MIAINESPLRVILELSDNEGYTQKELSNKTGMKKTNIYKYINDIFLENSIVYARKEPIKKKNRGLKRVGDFYYIGPDPSASPDEKLDVFQIIFNSSLKNLDAERQERLLASKYVNSIIETCGLMPSYESFYQCIEERLDGREFRKLASRALLSQPAFVEEYIKLPASMKEYIKKDKRYMRNFSHCLKYDKHLDFLFKFDPLEVIKFYRRYLSNDFIRLYRDITDMEEVRSENPYITDAVKEFIALDIHLSPATSFPRDDPISLLFARQFDRLYNDVYIIDDSDRIKAIERAYIIYSNFAEIVRHGIESQRREEDRMEISNRFLYGRKNKVKDSQKNDYLKLQWRDAFSSKQSQNNLIKRLIFYWNIAALRVDFIYFNHKNSFNGGGFHIETNSNGIQAINIDGSRKGMWDFFMTNKEMATTSLLSAEADPFSSIRYCYCFKDLNLKEKHTSIEEISSSLESIQ